MDLFAKHSEILNKAIKANKERGFFAQYPEHPSPAVYGETADGDGMKKFQASLKNKFTDLLQADSGKWAGSEESPYTLEPLGISYPVYSADVLISNAKKTFVPWSKAGVNTRTGILIESLERVKTRFFEIAYATMHTTGQGYMMAFQASGPHAADRALEAIAMGYDALTSIPEKVFWDKPAGKFNLQLNKTWRAVPKGITLVIGCSTFPTWNSVTGIYASLITGNPVIVKPHPMAILPIAIFVAEIQKVLKENGFSPETCQLGVDTPDALIGKTLAEHPDIKIIDFTGNAVFGNYLEGLNGKTVFTEKTGVNSIIIDSTDDLDKALQNLAFSVSLYSGQMCTAPQNFYIPASGVKTPNGQVGYQEVVDKFVSFVKGLYENPKAGPYVLGAIQSKLTMDRVKSAPSMGGKVLLESSSIVHPQFPNARIATPTILELESSQKEAFATECFGPIVFIIKTKGTDESIALASELATRHGALSCGAYTLDQTIKEKIMDEMGTSCTSVSFNLQGGVYLNQNAAFSDFHGTGGNPAANASFTNSDYVTRRFTWVGFREPAPMAAV